MRIVLVNATDSGGAGMATFRLYHALKKLGVEVKVLLQKAKKPEIQENPDVHTLINSPFAKVKYLLRTKRERALIGSENPKNFSSGMTGVSIKNHELIKWADVVHLHWINDSFLKTEELSTLGKPIVWTLHDMWPYSCGAHFTKKTTYRL